MSHNTKITLATLIIGLTVMGLEYLYLTYIPHDTPYKCINK